MRFVKNWDEKLLTMLAKCNDPKAILTTYPVGYERNKSIPAENKPPFMVAEEFGSDGMLRLKGKLLNKTFDKPIPAYFWVSGFAFSSAEVIREVPYDPHLPFLFFGEEELMNVRLWTHGWNFYAPGQSIIFHLWERSYPKKLLAVSRCCSRDHSGVHYLFYIPISHLFV
jgi:[Skp1-protein]-hydroxyproline N-acetylglucosaminyltransferase